MLGYVLLPSLSDDEPILFGLPDESLNINELNCRWYIHSDYTLEINPNDGRNCFRTVGSRDPMESGNKRNRGRINVNGRSGIARVRKSFMFNR